MTNETTSAAATRQASVGRSSAIMALGTFASRLTGALRTIVLTSFGIGALTDAYTQANTTPNMVYELVAGGVLSATLVPLFAHLLRRPTQRSRDGINAIFSIGLVVVIVASVALVLGAPLILRIPYGDASEARKLDVAVKLLRLFGPQVIFYGFVTLATAVLNVRRRFFAPMIAPVLNNVVVVLVLLYVRRMLQTTSGRDDLAKIASNGGARLLLGLGTTAGVAAMALALVPGFRAERISLRWHWDPHHPAIRELVRLSTWTFGYVACNQIALAFVQRAVTKGHDGDYTAYSSAYTTFFLLPHGLFAVSIATALQPELAEAFIERRRNRFRGVLARGIRMQATVMIPAAVGYLVLARPIVALFRFGDMTAHDVDVLAGVLRAFAVGLPCFSLYLMLMNACKAMRDTRITFQVNAIENAANILLASVFLLAGWGVQGLALAFALAYVVGALVAFEVVRRRLHGLRERELLASTGRVLVASSAMALATWGAARLVAGVLSERSRTGSLVQVGVAVTVGVTVYAAVGRVVGVSEITAVAGGLSRRFGGRSRPAPPAVSPTDEPLRRSGPSGTTPTRPDPTDRGADASWPPSAS